MAETTVEVKRSLTLTRQQLAGGLPQANPQNVWTEDSVAVGTTSSAAIVMVEDAHIKKNLAAISDTAALPNILLGNFLFVACDKPVTLGFTQGAVAKTLIVHNRFVWETTGSATDKILAIIVTAISTDTNVELYAAQV
jgi:hypothetical protein